MCCRYEIAVVSRSPLATLASTHHSRKVATVWRPSNEATDGRALAEPTLYHQRYEARRFHVDHVYVPRHWLASGASVTIGTYEQWIEPGYSDHVPVSVDLPATERPNHPQLVWSAARGAATRSAGKAPTAVAIKMWFSSRARCSARNPDKLKALSPRRDAARRTAPSMFERRPLCCVRISVAARAPLPPSAAVVSITTPRPSSDRWHRGLAIVPAS